MAANLLLQSDGSMLAAEAEVQSEGGNIWGTPTWALAVEHVEAWVKGLKGDWYAARVRLKQHQREEEEEYKAALAAAKEIGRPPPIRQPLTFPNPTTQDLLEAVMRKQGAMIQGFTQAVSNSRKVALLPALSEALPLASAASSSSSAAAAAASSSAAASASAASQVASSPAAAAASSPAAGKKRKQAAVWRSPRNRSKKQGQGEPGWNLEVMPEAPAQETVGLTECPAGCGKRRCTSNAGQYKVGTLWLRAQCVNHDGHMNNCTVHNGSQQCRSE